MRHVTLTDRMSLAREGFDVLIGHKHRVRGTSSYPHLRRDHFFSKTSPQLWTLVPHLTGSHELKPGNIHLGPSLELTGRGSFVGDRHQMIYCGGAGTSSVVHLSPCSFSDSHLADGDIHIWDRNSGDHLHRIPAQAIGGADLQCVAWSSTSEPSSMKFATISNKNLRIWSVGQPGHGLPTVQKPGPSSISPAPRRLSETELDIPLAQFGNG